MLLPRSYYSGSDQGSEINAVYTWLFVLPGPGPFPAVLDLWGMGGGLVEYRSALLASHGMASLALAYFGHKDIPGPLNRINVGDSYFRVRRYRSIVC